MAKPSGNRKRDREKSFDRKTLSRRVKPVILVVCEGEKTEPQYFEIIKEEYRQSITIHILPGKGNARQVVRDAKKRLRQEAMKARKGYEYQAIWCVFDMEDASRAAIAAQAIQEAEAAEFKLAVSNPSFEVWLLLHHTYTDRPFPDAAAVIVELQRHVPHYDKAMDFSEFIALTAGAIARAERLEQHNRDSSDKFPNPSTTVQHLVKDLHIHLNS